MRILIAFLSLTLGACAGRQFPAPAPPDPPGEMEFADGKAWMITSPLVWSIGSTTTRIVVPVGFVHDKASIPQALWPLLPKSGQYTRAAVIHDYLYWTQQCTREQADNLLLIAMKESDVGWATRRAVYRGVRAGGQPAWDANRRERLAGEPRFNLTIQPRGNMTWPEVRGLLRDLRVSDPPLDANAEYCAIGNSQEVP